MTFSKQRKAALVHSLMISAMLAGAYYLQAPLPVSTTQAEVSARTLANYHNTDSLDALPDFASIHDVQLKKQAFFDFLQPYVDAKNAQVRSQRFRLELLVTKIKMGFLLGHDDNVFLWDLARKYDLKSDDLHEPGYLDRLLHRVDVIPPSLVLAQAANESGWGTSRFAQEGFNFFGQWCYTDGCGLVPGDRGADASHEVKSFASVEEAVNAYFRNLNTFQSYQDMRVIRQTLRQGSKPIDGISLTLGLAKYSEKGQQYIHDLQAVIYKNNLLARDRIVYP